MDPTPMDELLELAFGEPTSEEGDEEDFISRALDALSGLSVAEPQDEMEAALDALMSGTEQDSESSAVDLIDLAATAEVAVSQAEQVTQPAPVPPAPKPALTIAEQKHELLVQLRTLKRQHGGLEKVPRDKLDDLREVTEHWDAAELDAWRKSMGTYVLLQAQLPAEKRDVSGINLYFDALTVFIDQAFDRPPRRVKNAMMARCSYIMLGAHAHMARRAPRLGRNGEYNVANMLRIWSSCYQWLNQSNTLEKPEAQALLEHCCGYVTDFVRNIRTGWESEKSRIQTDDIRNIVGRDPVEVEIFSAQGKGAEAHLAEGEKVFASALTRSTVDSQTVALLERVLVLYHAYKRAKTEVADPEDALPEMTGSHQQALGLLQSAKEKYEEAQELEESLVGSGNSRPRKVVEERQQEEEETGTKRRKKSRQPKKGLSWKIIGARRKRASALFEEAQNLEAKAGEIFASLEHGDEPNPFLDALGENLDLASPGIESEEDEFDALLETLL